MTYIASLPWAAAQPYTARRFRNFLILEGISCRLFLQLQQSRTDRQQAAHCELCQADQHQDVQQALPPNRSGLPAASTATRPTAFRPRIPAGLANCCDRGCRQQRPCCRALKGLSGPFSCVSLQSSLDKRRLDKRRFTERDRELREQIFLASLLRACYANLAAKFNSRGPAANGGMTVHQSLRVGQFTSKNQWNWACFEVLSPTSFTSGRLFFRGHQ